LGAINLHIEVANEIGKMCTLHFMCVDAGDIAPIRLFPWRRGTPQTSGPYMTPIATYRERRLEGNRLFELYEDRVIVRGKLYLSTDFETPVLLKNLSPVTGRMKSRTAGAWVSGFVALVSVAVLLWIFDHFLGYLDEPLLVGGLAGVLAILLTLFVFIRKIEFINFISDDGAIRLNIGRSGPDKEMFQEFVGLVIQQIEKTREGPNTSVEKEAK
jgi:hypothetical protein